MTALRRHGLHLEEIDSMPDKAVQYPAYECDRPRQERLFRVLFENSPDAIVLLHILPEGREIRFLDLNAATCRYLGYSRNELLNLSWQDLIAHFSITDRELLFQEIENSILTGSPAIREVMVTRKDGTRIPMEISRTPVAEEGHTAILVIARDITERRKAMAAQEVAHRKLSLVSSITRHDVLNQLTIIRGYLNLMKRIPSPDPRLKVYLQKEERAADTIAQLIGFSQDYSRMGALEPQWQDLKMTIVRALQHLDTGQVMITMEAGAVTIYADPLLEKVFFNLTENAIRYGGKITRISFSCRENNEGLVIVCEDDGIGIPEAEKENIFHRQYYRHTGLGLSLSRDILAFTGLSIRETGTPGAGAHFEIIVPSGLYHVCPGGE